MQRFNYYGINYIMKYNKAVKQIYLFEINCIKMVSFLCHTEGCCCSPILSRVFSSTCSESHNVFFFHPFRFGPSFWCTIVKLTMTYSLLNSFFKINWFVSKTAHNHNFLFSFYVIKQSMTIVT